MILISDFIPYTFKKFKFKFYHSTKGHTFSFWSCYIRYTILVIDKFSVEFSFLMPLLHLSLETTYRFIHLRHFFTIAFFTFFLMNIRQFISFLVFCQILPEVVVNLCKCYSKEYISFHFISQYLFYNGFSSIGKF